VSKAVVMCSHQLAAQAGEHVLRTGGNAVDAAVATALALAVVDPPNCTLTGYGGYMTVKKPQDAQANVVDFNTTVPEGYDSGRCSEAPKINGFLYGGVSVSVPGVPAGLLAAHQCFGSKEFSSLAEHAITVAEDGFRVGKNLARALAWAHTVLPHTNAAWQEIFAPKGSVLREGDPLVQRDLAQTLRQYVAAPSSFYTGDIGSRLAQDVLDAGGVITANDMAQMRATVAVAATCVAGGCEIHGPPVDFSGFGIFKRAFEELVARGDVANLTVKDYVSALQNAWSWRRSEIQLPASPTQHTTHFCVVDASGFMVACTFTLGPLWFGSLRVLEGTGLVLNCGLNLIRQHRRSGELMMVNNLTPIVARDAQNRLYAAGTPGGTRIPAVVLRLFLESALAGRSLQEAMELPRIAARPDGTPELEAVFDFSEHYEALGAEDFYGPASVVRKDAQGELEIGRDPRFETGVAWV
jgi:gamma-glutamyltranspeptidase / glutathione hydrolase